MLETQGSPSNAGAVPAQGNPQRCGVPLPIHRGIRDPASKEEVQTGPDQLAAGPHADLQWPRSAKTLGSGVVSTQSWRLNSLLSIPWIFLTVTCPSHHRRECARQSCYMGLPSEAQASSSATACPISPALRIASFTQIGPKICTMNVVAVITLMTRSPRRCPSCP